MTRNLKKLLWCDLKTDKEKIVFLQSGFNRTGVIAKGLAEDFINTLRCRIAVNEWIEHSKKGEPDEPDYPFERIILCDNLRQATRDRDVRPKLAGNLNKAATMLEKFARALNLVSKVGLANYYPWITVDDHLPDHCSKVMVAYKNILGNGRIVIAVRYDALTEECCCEHDCNCDYDAKRDNCYLPGGWYEITENNEEFGLVRIDDEITHWLPLPMLPQFDNVSAFG